MGMKHWHLGNRALPHISCLSFLSSCDIIPKLIEQVFLYERAILKIIAIAFFLASLTILALWKMGVRLLAAIFQLSATICLIFALKQTSIELKKF